MNQSRQIEQTDDTRRATTRDFDQDEEDFKTSGQFGKQLADDYLSAIQKTLKKYFDNLESSDKKKFTK